MTSIDPKFVIFASGFRSVSLQHATLYDQKIQIPSLHISGTTDKVISHAMHLALEDAFSNPEILHHTGGHFLPATADEKPIYRKFFETQLRKLKEEKDNFVS